MRNLKLYFLPIGAIVLLLWCLLFASSVYGSTPTEPVTLTPQEYATLKTNFDTLESTINNQLTTINELEMQLKVAKLSTNEQKNELIEALNLISEQKTQLKEARNLLQKARTDVERAKVIINESRNILRTAEERNQKAKMQQRKSKLLNILLGGTVIYLVAKD